MNKTRNRAALLTTAVTFVVAVPGLVQAQSLIPNEQLANLTEECRLVVQDYEREGNSQIIPRDEVTRILTANEPTRCAETRQRLAEASGAAVATDAVRLEQEAVIEGEAVVQVPAPQVSVQEQAAQVRVQEAQPNVQVTAQPTDIVVQQSQPRVTIDVPEISVRVEIPAPSIFITARDPNMQISQADPQVEVVQAAPQVSVTQGEPQLAVDLDVDQGADDAEAGTAPVQPAAGAAGQATATEGEVSMNRSEAQVEILQPQGAPQLAYQKAEPRVTYEPVDPEVTVNMPQEPQVELVNVGEPRVTFETQAEREARLQQSQQQPAAAAATAPQTATVGDLMNMQVVGADGDELGSPQAFVRRDNEVLLVLRDGGFLGLGGKQIGIPMSRVTVDGENLQLRNMTADEIDAAGEFQFEENERLGNDSQVPLSSS